MRTVLAICLAAGLAAGCGRNADVDRIPAGTRITVNPTEGDTLVGELVKVDAETITIRLESGEQRTLPRSRVESVAMTEIPLAPSPATTPQAPATEPPATPAPAPETPARPAPDQQSSLRPATPPSDPPRVALGITRPLTIRVAPQG